VALRSEKLKFPKVGGRALLASVLTGVALLGLGLVAFDCLVLPTNDARGGTKLYDYVYATGKSENVDFVSNNMSSNGYLCFGSSEWYVSKNLVSTCPQAVLGESDAGVDMTFIGEGYDQSLWQAIAAGAYGTGDKIKNRKIMIVVSPQWFFKGSGDQSKFSSKFSYSLYRAFMQSDSISDETKAYVRQRCAALDVDSSKLAAASHDTVLDAINDAAYATVDAWKLRSQLTNIQNIAPEKSTTRLSSESTGQTSEPDWSSLLATAESEGAAACTNNDYGVYDAYWEKNHTYDPELFQNFSEADDEYNDLRCLLEVCREVGFEPMVCILQVHGQWYDISDVSSDERQSYYQKIRSICTDAGVTYADFSAYEYEKYFLCDTVHPGWKGWVRIEHAFYDFVNDRRGEDDCLTWGSDE
jgi:D-alanine transfer protein